MLFLHSMAAKPIIFYKETIKGIQRREITYTYGIFYMYAPNLKKSRH
jgi:hypothetical protein